MELYFSALACSLASRITIYEAGAAARFVRVDTHAKRTEDGADYLAVNPLGLVPCLRTEAGELLTENAAILQYLADRYPESALAPSPGPERTQLQRWLSFVSSELHAGLFNPLLDRRAPPEVKAYVLEKGRPRLDVLARHLEGREYLLDRFSVADAYLFTVLNWSAVTPLELASWPTLAGYVERLRRRPSIARAFREERALYIEELARSKAL